LRELLAIEKNLRLYLRPGDSYIAPPIDQI